MPLKIIYGCNRNKSKWLIFYFIKTNTIYFLNLDENEFEPTDNSITAVWHIKPKPQPVIEPIIDELSTY